MCFFHLGVFLISVKPSTTENTEIKLRRKFAKLQEYFTNQENWDIRKLVAYENVSFYSKQVNMTLNVPERLWTNIRWRLTFQLILHACMKFCEILPLGKHDKLKCSQNVWPASGWATLTKHWPVGLVISSFLTSFAPAIQKLCCFIL